MLGLLPKFDLVGSGFANGFKKSRFLLSVSCSSNWIAFYKLVFMRSKFKDAALSFPIVDCSCSRKQEIGNSPCIVDVLAWCL
jgi:hypothetical protein